MKYVQFQTSDVPIPTTAGIRLMPHRTNDRIEDPVVTYQALRHGWPLHWWCWRNGWTAGKGRSCCSMLFSALLPAGGAPAALRAERREILGFGRPQHVPMAPGPGARAAAAHAAPLLHPTNSKTTKARHGSAYLFLVQERLGWRGEGWWPLLRYVRLELVLVPLQRVDNALPVHLQGLQLARGS